MSTPIPPILPFPDDGEPDGVPTREVDGDRVLDDDVDPNRIDSADADRLATERDEDDYDDGDDDDV